MCPKCNKNRSRSAVTAKAAANRNNRVAPATCTAYHNPIGYPSTNNPVGYPASNGLLVSPPPNAMHEKIREPQADLVWEPVHFSHALKAKFSSIHGHKTD